MRVPRDPGSYAVGTGCTVGCAVMILFIVIAGGSAAVTPSWVTWAGVLLGIAAAIGMYLWMRLPSKALEKLHDQGFDESIVCEVLATYFGGHKACPQKADVKLFLTNRRFVVKNLGYPIFYADVDLRSIIDFGADTKERLTASRLLLTGILAFALKKEEQYLWVKYTDHNGFEQNPVFGSDFKQQFARFQRELYTLLAQIKNS